MIYAPANVQRSQCYSKEQVVALTVMPYTWIQASAQNARLRSLMILCVYNVPLWFAVLNDS